MFVAIGVGAYGVAIFHLVHARVLQGLPVPRRRQRDPRAGRRAGHHEDGRAAREDPVTFVTFAIATAAIAGIRRSPASSRRTRSSGSRSPAARRLAVAVRGRRGDRAADRVLHVPPALAHVLRRAAHGRRDRAPRPRVAAVDDRRAGRARRASAVGGFIAVPHFLEPLLPLPPVDGAGHSVEKPLSCARWRSRWPGWRAPRSVRRRRQRAERLRERATRCTAGCSGKYYVDELYDALLGRPLHWISERVFLRLRRPLLIDGTLHGWPPRSRGGAGVLGARADRQPAALRLLVLLGIVGRRCLWSWRHG